jgi:superfamily II DNA or RNA helicase
VTTDIVEFHPINAVHARISASPGVMAEIKDFMTFDVPGARYSQLYKKGHWDGRISLFKNGRLYTGLQGHLEAFCARQGYEFYNSKPMYPVPPTDDEIDDFIETLNIPEKFEARHYQSDAFRKATETHRALFLSPTSSGKSLMIYHLIRWHDVKTLIIVPTVSLVHQLAGDFVDYGAQEDTIHTISAGDNRWTDRNITISTWQSVVKMLDTPEWFEQFGMVIGDEAHRFAAKSLIAIMESFTECTVRYGYTGSLDDSKCNALTLEGLFGPVYQVTTTRELMDSGHVSDLAINVLFLKHPEHIRKKKFKYQEEVNYLIGCKARNEFLADLALNLSGNTLLLYHRIGDHGKPLYENIKSRTDRPVHFIHGGVDGEDRNAVRKLIEEQDDAIIVASVGTFSTGINIKRLHNIITSASWKSRVMNLQSLGRGLRLADDKTICNLYDIVDDMSWKKHKNYTLMHGEIRIKLYNEQKFQYTMERIGMDY